MVKSLLWPVQPCRLRVIGAVLMVEWPQGRQAQGRKPDKPRGVPDAFAQRIAVPGRDVLDKQDIRVLDFTRALLCSTVRQARGLIRGPETASQLGHEYSSQHLRLASAENDQLGPPRLARHAGGSRARKGRFMGGQACDICLLDLQPGLRPAVEP